MLLKLSMLVGLIAHSTSLPIGIAAAGEIQFQYEKRPTVTRAQDIIQTPEKRVEFGTQLVFKQLQTPQANRIRRNGFQIRVFSLYVNETRPRPITTIGNCDIYISDVYVIHQGNSPEIVVERMGERWMALSSSGRTVFNGHHLFVFEALEAGGGKRERVFRLHKDDAEEYFKTGFDLTVDGRVSVEQVRAAYTTVVNLAEEIDKKGQEIPCYRYLKYAGEAAEQHHTRGNLEICDANVAG
jgi:hypothetical protein